MDGGQLVGTLDDADRVFFKKGTWSRLSDLIAAEARAAELAKLRPLPTTVRESKEALPKKRE
jgi:hypothetical protein